MCFSDSKLLTLIGNGNEIAFKQIYDKYWKRLYLFALKLLPSEGDAKDVVQEVFCNLWVKADRLQIENLESYLYSMTKNKCFDHLRRKKYSDEALTEIILQTILSDSNPEDHLEYMETKKNLEKSLFQLPPKTRQVFQLSRNFDLSNKQIASKLNISVKAVEYHMTQSIKHLKSELAS